MVRRWVVVVLALVALVVTFSAPAGAAGVDVAKWQKRLNALHCNAGPVDGKSGTWTRSALIRFQSRYGIAQTGSYSSATRTRLFAAGARRCDVRPLPARSGSGRRIVISQKQNWVWVVAAGNRVVAQGGIVDNPSALHKGSFRTGSYCGRSSRVKKNRSGSLWLDDFVRFAPCGFGFHRIPRAMSNGRQIHADYLLGTNLAASHGCVRLSSAMAHRIWTFTASGRTAVRVI
jgi:Putative peptidoglycan binding domain/L,D-transpeptidase catalytic domain